MIAGMVSRPRVIEFRKIRISINFSKPEVLRSLETWFLAEFGLLNF